MVALRRTSANRWYQPFIYRQGRLSSDYSLTTLSAAVEVSAELLAQSPWSHGFPNIMAASIHVCSINERCATLRFPKRTSLSWRKSSTELSFADSCHRCIRVIFDAQRRTALGNHRQRACCSLSTLNNGKCGVLSLAAKRTSVCYRCLSQRRGSRKHHSIIGWKAISLDPLTPSELGEMIEDSKDCARTDGRENFTKSGDFSASALSTRESESN